MFKRVLGGLGLATLAGAASAEVPAAATAAIVSLQDDALSMVSTAWPVIAAIVIGFVGFKLFKRIVAKV